MWIVEQKNGKTFSLPAKLVEPKHAKAALSPLAWKILQILAEEPSYPREIGKRLRVHEQKIYYHIKNLGRAGMIKIVKEENIHGVTAKYYGIEEPALALLLKDMEHSQKLFSMKKEHERFFQPFIEAGNLNAIIIVGSPEPHGPTRARARDGPYAINFGLFLGSLLNYIPPASIKLDTEVSGSDLKDNLIIIGGPGVNRVSAKINDKLPVRFKESEEQKNFYTHIYSSLSKKCYAEEETGIIVKTKNPFAADKQILVLAGKRHHGTKAAILGLMQKFDEICSGNKYNKKVLAKVVEGVDADADGVIDSVEIKE